MLSIYIYVTKSHSINDAIEFCFDWYKLKRWRWLQLEWVECTWIFSIVKAQFELKDLKDERGLKWYNFIHCWLICYTTVIFNLYTSAHVNFSHFFTFERPWTKTRTLQNWLKGLNWNVIMRQWLNKNVTIVRVYV